MQKWLEGPRLKVHDRKQTGAEEPSQEERNEALGGPGQTRNLKEAPKEGDKGRKGSG
jgi:hypothetical protein